MQLEEVEASADGEAIEDLGDVEGLEVVKPEYMVGTVSVRGGGGLWCRAKGLDALDESLAEGVAKAGRSGRGVGLDESREGMCLEVAWVVEVGESVAGLTLEAQASRGGDGAPATEGACG